MLVVIAIVVFVGCALAGYNIARGINPQPSSPENAVEIPVPLSEQHNYMIVRVDDLGSQKPQLKSVWFVSLSFVSQNPNLLALAQIYPPKTAGQKSTALERAFALSEKGEPAAAFWNAVKQYKLDWEGYILFDAQGANLFLQWLVGPADFQGALEESAKNDENSLRMAQQVCQSITDASGRSLGQFSWSQVIPDHFRSDLQLATALAYWDRMTDPAQSVRCEFLPSP
jgi:hypothetical protein